MPIIEKMETSDSFTKSNLSLCNVVHLPQVDELSADFLHPCKVSGSPINVHKPQQYSTCLPEGYLKKIASDFSFSMEVVKLRALPNLSYKEWDAKSIYNNSDIIPSFKLKEHIPKMQPKLDPPKHQPCQMKHAVPFHKRAAIKYSQNLGETMLKTKMDDCQTTSSSLSVSSLSGADAESVDSRTFLTQLPEIASVSAKANVERRSEISTSLDQSTEWYDEVLKKLTKNTVQWIVSQQIAHCVTRNQLKQRYNLSNVVDLITDENMTERDFKIGEEQEATAVEEDSCLANDSQPEIPLPIYYQGLSMLWGKSTKDEPSSKNKTAEELSVKNFEPFPQVKLQKVINPRAGKSIYTTENIFERELYFGGGRIVYQRDADKDRITMSSHNEYLKHLQERFPTSFKQWSLRKTQTGAGQKSVKGAIRWTALPTLIDAMKEMNLKSPVSKIIKQEKLKEGDEVLIPPDDLHIMWNMVKDWKTAWFLNVHWRDTTVEQLRRDLESLHDDCRIAALATCASGALERHRHYKETIILDTNKKHLSIPDVPEDLQPLIMASLKDKNPRVRMAAAVCHYALRLENDEARDIMLDALHHGNDADSWAAAQCLASEGNATSTVVNRILNQFFDLKKESIKEQACKLLGCLSKGTSLVHILLANGMNSSSWRERILSCQAVSHLHGNVNQDFKNKLSYLMWNDWNTAVRHAAAQALGSLGFGKEVHDHLRDMLEIGDSGKKVEALSLISKLKLMTTKLLPGFLQCFSDDYMAVRKEACITAGALQIKDEMVLHNLMKRIRRDFAWKIRLFAIKALGQIGHVSMRLKELLLWAIHHEPDPRVRIQACRTIVTLQMQDHEVQATLQESLVLEPHPLVKKELKEALGTLTFDPIENEMLQKMENKLSILNQKDNVIARVLKLEEIIEDEYEQVKRIFLKKEEIEDKIEQYNDLPGVLGAAFSGKDYATKMRSLSTWTTNTEKHMESPSRPWQQETKISQRAQEDHKKLYVRGRSASSHKTKQSSSKLMARK